MTTQDLQILTITEVAEYLKVAERMLYRLGAAKKIPAFKVGGVWRFAKADIERWIKEQAITSHEDHYSVLDENDRDPS